MKIDKDKLVDLLVDKTSMQKEEVQAQLDQLIDRIVDAASRGKALEIKDFGLFYFDESQELKFEAAKELSTEISFKYAGMRPVELQPERDSTIVSDFQPSESEQEEKDDDEFEESPFAKAADDEEDDPFEDLFEEDEAAQKKEKEDSDDIFEDDDDLDDFDFLSDLPDEQEEPKPDEKPAGEKEKIKASTAKFNRQPVRKKNNAGIWVVAAILLLAVIGGVFYYFSEVQQTGQQATTPTQTAQPEPLPEELPVISDEQLADEVPDTPTPEIEPEQEPPVEVPTQAEPLETVAPEDQPLYGLTGIVNEAANDGYSIVLHSFNDEVNARQTAEMLGNDGYRVLVSSRNVANNTMWRVSVGQFETLADAQEAISRLPSPYNTQNFIHRIQIN